MAKNKKLSPAQKFRRRLAALRHKQAPLDGAFFEHDNRSLTSEPDSQSSSLRVPSTVMQKKSHKKARSKEYWNRIKIIKKQQLAMQRLIVSAVCGQAQHTNSCCCRCACPPAMVNLLPKAAKNGENFTQNLNLTCGSSRLNIQEFQVEEISRRRSRKMRSVLR